MRPLQVSFENCGCYLQPSKCFKAALEKVILSEEEACTMLTSMAADAPYVKQVPYPLVPSLYQPLMRRNDKLKGYNETAAEISTEQKETAIGAAEAKVSLLKCKLQYNT